MTRDGQHERGLTTLLMRLSNAYPNSMKHYRLKLDGAVKKAFGE